jgi:hypothetical protein
MNARRQLLVMIVSLSLMFTPIVLTAQPDTIWTKTFQGVGFDEGYSIQQTNGGGYIVAGVTGLDYYPLLTGDVWLLKIDSSGDTTWTQTFGGSSQDVGASVQQTSDGGYIIAGSTRSFGAGGGDVWLIKTDASGDTLWTKTFGGTDSESGSSVQQTSDGGYIIAGSTRSFGAGLDDVWLIKTNASGDTLWTKTYGGSSYDEGYSVQQTSDGGYIITASFRANSSDVMLIKTNASGDTLWTRILGSEADASARSLQQTSDGGYIITGGTGGTYAGIEIGGVLLIRFNALGDTLWTKTFSSHSRFRDEGYSVQQTSDGGYIIAGIMHSYDTYDGEAWLLKTDASGDTLWTRTFGGSDYVIGYSVQQTSDGGYIMTGTKGSDVWLVRLAPDTISVVGREMKDHFPIGFSLSQNYPNPFNPTTSISYDLPETSDLRLTIYDITGRTVATLADVHQPAGSYTTQWNGSDDSGNPVSTGVYFCRLQARDYSKTIKMVYLR